MIDREIYLDAQDIAYVITALDEHAYRIVQDLTRTTGSLPIAQAGPGAQKESERASRCAEIASKLTELLAGHDRAVVCVERVTP